MPKKSFKFSCQRRSSCVSLGCWEEEKRRRERRTRDDQKGDRTRNHNQTVHLINLFFYKYIQSKRRVYEYESGRRHWGQQRTKKQNKTPSEIKGKRRTCLYGRLYCAHTWLRHNVDPTASITKRERERRLDCVCQLLAGPPLERPFVCNTTSSFHGDGQLDRCVGRERRANSCPTSQPDICWYYSGRWSGGDAFHPAGPLFLFLYSNSSSADASLGCQRRPGRRCFLVFFVFLFFIFPAPILRNFELFASMTYTTTTMDSRLG